MSEVPYIAVANNELGAPLYKGDRIKCRACGRQHRVRLGTDAETGKESPLLQFVRCGKKSLLVGINGRRL